MEQKLNILTVKVTQYVSEPHKGNACGGSCSKCGGGHCGACGGGKCA